MSLVPSAQGAEAPLRVITFAGIQNLAIYVAQAHGFFAKRGLTVDLQFTPNSQVLREGLAKGTYDIAHAAVDNAVAMVELAGADVVAVMGGDNGFNQLHVEPDIRSYEDLRGKTVIVDAPNTAYALILYKMLRLHGLQKGDYAVKPIGGTAFRLEAMRKDRLYKASMLELQYSLLAEQEGLPSLGTAVQAIGPYQASSGLVMRAWAKANANALIRYIQAYVEGRRWAMNPANKAETVGLMVDRLKLSPELAGQLYALVTDPVNGFAKDAKFDLDGFKNVLKLRAEIEGQWGGTPPPPERYLDLTYYERALGGL